MSLCLCACVVHVGAVNHSWDAAGATGSYENVWQQVRSSYPAHSPGRKGPGSRSEHSLIQQSLLHPPAGRGLDESMMADSLMGGSDTDAPCADISDTDDHSVDQSPSQSPARPQYQFRYRSADGDGEASRCSGDMDEFMGIGGATAEPLPLLHSPQLTDTVHYVASSYSDFFRRSLSGDRLHAGRAESQQRGGEHRTALSPPRSASSPRNSPGRSPSRNSSSYSSQHTASSQQQGDEDGYTARYMSTVSPASTMTLTEALHEIEHLRRTSQSLEKALGQETQWRKKFEQQLVTSQVSNPSIALLSLCKD